MPSNAEIDAWRALATSYVLENRMLALELANAIKSEIQSELLFWFSSNQAWEFKYRIFKLLDAKHQKIAERLSPKIAISSLGPESNFQFYLFAETVGERESILRMEAEGHQLMQSKMLFYRYLQEQEGISIKECRQRLIELLERVKS